MYDERWHLHNVELVHQVGWHEALTHTLSAAGPLYTSLHLVLEPITHLEGPPLRATNVVLLLAVVALTAAAGAALRLREPWLTASTLLAVPFAWPVCGMALTEIPALIFFTAGLLGAVRLWEKRKAPLPVSIAWAVATGLAFGVACLGRQTYLLARAGRVGGVCHVGSSHLAARRGRRWHGGGCRAPAFPGLGRHYPAEPSAA